MKRIAYIFFAACLIGLIPFRCPAEEQDEAEYDETYTSLDSKETAIDIPPGMELRKMGSIKMIVPKGTQVRKKNSLVIMEGPDEYAARNIYEMNGRLMELEAKQLNIEKAILKLQKSPGDQ